MRSMMVWAHDLRCIPTSLANKIPAASISRGGYRGGKTVPPPVTTSPIDRPFASIGVAAREPRAIDGTQRQLSTRPLRRWGWIMSSSMA